MRTQTMIAECCTRACGQLRMSTNSLHDDLDAVFKQKRLLRTQVRKTLKSMDPSLRSHQDNAVQDLVLGAPWFKSSRSLCAYISCAALREVDTYKLLSQILQHNNATGASFLVFETTHFPILKLELTMCRWKKSLCAARRG
ncbi:5-formyltetrahydrofolate cyclo-ligase, mitochondrial, partial [Mucuna pruriens]